MDIETNYWFPAKRRGWGWGLPIRWQGWLVLGIFCAALTLGAVVLLPGHGAMAFAAQALALSGILVVVCWLKGEPTRWR